jgi:hypothetical protein
MWADVRELTFAKSASFVANAAEVSAYNTTGVYIGVYCIYISVQLHPKCGS